MADLIPSGVKSGGNFIPQLWAKEAMLARRNKVVAANLVNRTYESDMSYGDTMNIPFVANLTADAITPGTALTAVAPTESYVQLLVNKYYGKAVSLNDMAKKQSKYDLAKIYGGQIGETLARQIDTDVLAEVSTGSTNTAIDTTTAATYANVVAAVTALDAVNVPLEDRAFIVNAKFMGDLRTLAEFTRYDAIGSMNPSVAKDSNHAQVGFIYGIPVFLSNNVRTVAGTPAKDHNVLIQKDAIGLVVQKDVNIETDRQAIRFATDIVGSCLYGVKTLRGDHSVVLKRN